MLHFFSLFTLLFFFVLSTPKLNAQEDTSIMRVQEFDELKFPSNYHKEYRRLLNKVKKVYPLALHAAFVVDSLEQAIAEANKNRHKKKIARETHNQLKDEFKFLLKSLYVSEGVVLSKLIHRETGLTVEEIIEKYKGGTQATLYRSLASMFDQQLDAIYDPDNDDFVLECIIRDIKLGKIEINEEFETMSRADYREDKRAYKERVKNNKKNVKEVKREQRQEKRALKD
jgi:hypothetical protein